MTTLSAPAGLAFRLCLVLAVVDVVSAFMPLPVGGVLPSLAVLVVALMGAVTVGVAPVVAGRNRPSGLLVVAASRAVAGVVGCALLPALTAVVTIGEALVVVVIISVLDVSTAAVLVAEVRGARCEPVVAEPLPGAELRRRDQRVTAAAPVPS